MHYNKLFYSPFNSLKYFREDISPKTQEIILYTQDFESRTQKVTFKSYLNATAREREEQTSKKTHINLVSYMLFMEQYK